MQYPVSIQMHQKTVSSNPQNLTPAKEEGLPQ
jgi:hypothetical protein